jgi:small subunit ribosomal protein S8
MKNSVWNMISNIKNGQVVKKAFIILPPKKLCVSFLNILWNEGFILGYKIEKRQANKIKIFLKYKNGVPVINSLISISKPSLRKYYSLNQLWKIKSNNSLLIISTNKGLHSLEECKKLGFGGELFLLIR